MEISGFQFPTPAILRWEHGDGAEYRLEEPFHFLYVRDGAPVHRIGPSWRQCPDFRFDGASVPESLQWLIHKNGEHTGAALAHDLAYWLGRHKWPGWQFMSREEADRLFDAALAITPGISAAQRIGMVEAVIIWGKDNAWDDDTGWGGVDVPETDPENPQDLG